MKNAVVIREVEETTYSSYLELDQVLSAQRPVTHAHDETMFIVIHQVHELWFKLLLHELAGLQEHLAAAADAPTLHTLRRSLAIMKTVVGQMDVMDTLTPAQFGAFRGCLGTASGAQSAQFRELETVLGRRDRRVLDSYQEGGADRLRLEEAMNRPSVFDSFLRYLALQGYPVPGDVLFRDVSQPLDPSPEVQDLLFQVLRDELVPAHICEALLDFDQLVQEWRYRHGRMVRRVIGTKPGTGGSSGAACLHATLATPVWPDLWAVRGRW